MYYVNIHIYFTINLAVTKKTVGDGEKLLTYVMNGNSPYVRTKRTLTLN
jgi:hypothetical protein